MAGDRLLNEWVAQQLPYNTNCPRIRDKINWKRERLIKKIKAITHADFIQDNEPGEAGEVPNDTAIDS